MTIDTALPTLSKARKRTRKATAQPAPSDGEATAGTLQVIELLAENGDVDEVLEVSDRAAEMFAKHAADRPLARLRYVTEARLDKVSRGGAYVVRSVRRQARV